MKLSAPILGVLMANFLLIYLISTILQQSIIENTADYYKYSFFVSSLLYALSISFVIHEYGLIKSLIVIITYITWFYIFKTMSIDSQFDITINQLLYIHLLMIILWLITIYCLFWFYNNYKKLYLCFGLTFILFCCIYIDLYYYENPNIYKVLLINEKVETWNGYGFGNSINNDNECIININNTIIPWFDILPHRIFNFFMGYKYQCIATNFSFINFETNKLIIHCDVNVNQFKIYFGTDYLEKYEKISKKHFDVNDLSNWKDKFIKNESFPYHLIKYNKMDAIHSIDIISLSKILKYNQELITIECGLNINTHFIPQTIMNNNINMNNNEKEYEFLPSSVVIFIIDATSRHEFHRKLTKTSSLMNKIISSKYKTNHEIYEFFRYNVIGHSTNNNLQPFFFGGNLNGAINEKYEEKLLNNSLWSIAKQNGFITSLLWDDCKTQWNYKVYKNHLNTSPDHFNIVGCDYDFNFYGQANMFQGGKGSIALNDKCNKQKFVFQHLLEYQILLRKIENKNKIFSISHTVVGHDGVGVSVISIDDYLSKWLQDIIHNNVWNDTLIILMSDHGMHFGLPTLTKIGNIEHSLGFMIWLYPKNKLNKIINKTLKHNEQSLFSLWDLRKTLFYLFNKKYNNDKNIISKKNLIIDKIPYNRTCNDASIPSHRCSCI